MGKRMGRARWSLPLLPCLLACSPAKPPPAPPPAPVLALPPGAADVAAFRGHPFRRDVPVNEVTRAKMRHVLEAQTAREARVSGESDAFLHAFGFLPMAAHVSTDASVHLEADALVGLYVPEDRAIYVRPHTRTSDAIDPGDTLHELGHALQDDVFGIDKMNAPVPDDEHLARRAVYEGDATVVAWGAAALRAGKSARQAVAEGRVVASAQASTLGVAQDVEAIPALEAAPPLTRVAMFFPYTAGSELAADAYLAGGTELMDVLFEKLPVSTEQVLHPEKYFKGELPIHVATPSPPPGWRVVAHGTMGELRTRALLEARLSAESATLASTGWGGDAYAVLERDPPSNGALAVLWSTAWDDDASASRFAAALDRATRDAGELGPVVMRRERTRVAWTRGLEGAEPQLETLLTLPGPRPADRPPHGEVLLPSFEAGRQILVPAGGDPNLLVPSLGLRARLPPRFESVSSKTRELTIFDRDSHGSGSLSHEAKPLDDAFLASMTISVAAIFSGGGALERPEVTSVALPVGPARRTRWKFANGTGEASLFAIPFCGGRQSLFLTTAARNEETRVALEQWVRSVEPTEAGLPAVCAQSK